MHASMHVTSLIYNQQILSFMLSTNSHFEYKSLTVKHKILDYQVGVTIYQHRR